VGKRTRKQSTTPRQTGQWQQRDRVLGAAIVPIALVILWVVVRQPEAPSVFQPGPRHPLTSECTLSQTDMKKVPIVWKVAPIITVEQHEMGGTCGNRHSDGTDYCWYCSCCCQQKLQSGVPLCYCNESIRHPAPRCNSGTYIANNTKITKLVCRE